MVKDFFELRIEDALHDNKPGQVQLYLGDLALIPYLNVFGTQLKDDSGYIGVIADSGQMNLIQAIL